MSDLAFFGGQPALESDLPPYPSMGQKERDAAMRVLDSGVLSGFYGSWGEQFFGGKEVKALEQEWSTRFGGPHAVSVNSATSGLIAAMGAVGIGPGDEVVVPPYTMSATAVAPLFYGGIPVFADIEAETYGLDPAAVEANLTDKTRAIIAVNLFGHAARLRKLKAIAEKHNLALVEDNAQAPLATEEGAYTGTIGDIGVFSLNVHKHIHAGEGGICVTWDESLARRLQLIRNHGENAVEATQEKDLSNLIGQNYRMTELTAAVARQQLRNIDDHLQRREHLAEHLSVGISGLEGLKGPVVREGCRHVYYVWSCQLNEAELGISRNLFVRALRAEGVPVISGYVKPLYHLPVFQRRMAIGNQGFPFNLSDRRYDGIECPVTEQLHNRTFIGFEVCAYDVCQTAADKLVEAFQKVHRAREQLKARAAEVLE